MLHKIKGPEHSEKKRHRSGKGWERSELDQIHAESMDINRIRNLIGNIDHSLRTLPQDTIDLRKLRDLKSFFEVELKKRGA